MVGILCGDGPGLGWLDGRRIANVAILGLDVARLTGIDEPFVEESVDSGRTKMQSATSQEAGDAPLSQFRATLLQATHDVAHKIRKAIDGWPRRDEGLVSFLVNTFYPETNGRFGYEEPPGCFGFRPTAQRSQCEDVESFVRFVVGASSRRDTFHAGVFDPQFLAKIVKLLFKLGATVAWAIGRRPDVLGRKLRQRENMQSHANDRGPRFRQLECRTGA